MGGRSLTQASLADDVALVDPGKHPIQPMLTDTVLHGAMRLYCLLEARYRDLTPGR